MVFFTCNSCGTVLKKNQVERHMGSCGRVVSCIDCLKDFSGQEFQAHTKCISEAEKYNGPDWKAPSSQNKGERKQLQWVETVNNALEKGRQTLTPSQIALMKLISKHDNVPRKKPKFMNFISNVAKRQFDFATIEEVWNHIETEWKSQAEQNKTTQGPSESNQNGDDSTKSTSNGTAQNGHSKENGEEDSGKKSKKKDKKRKRDSSEDAVNGDAKKAKGGDTNDDEEPQDENLTTEMNESEFRWGEVIQNILLAREDHSIKIKKLKKKVFAEYYSRVGDSKGIKTKEDLTAQLNKKLKKKKFTVVGEIVKLAFENGA